MSWLKAEFNLFILALGFLTRLPVAHFATYSEDRLGKSTRYYSLVGLIIATCIWCAFALIQPLLGTQLALLIALMVSVLLTGAFHEDGLADTVDGFGGAFESSRKLAIMKDSRVGTYGSIALWFTLTFKLIALAQIAEFGDLLVFLLFAHAVSRAAVVSMMRSLPYVQLDDVSKVKPVAQNIPLINIGLIWLPVLPLVWLLGVQSAVILLIVLIVRRWGIYWMEKHVGGYTGDGLGALQQIIEITVLLSCVAIHQTDLDQTLSAYSTQWLSGLGI